MIHANGRMTSKEKKYFYSICIIISTAAFWEWMAVLLNGAAPWTRQLHLLAKFMDYSTTPLCSLPFIMQMSSSRKLFKATVGVLVFNTIFEGASIFTGWTFYINEQNIHCHGPLFFVYILVFIFVTCFILAAFLEYGRRYESKNRGPLFAVIFLLGFSIFMQEYFGGEVRTDYLGMAISTTMLYIHYMEFDQINQDRAIVQKDKMLIRDALTGVLSRFAYMQMLTEYSSGKGLPDTLTAFEADLNGLKGVNDTLGHEAGDELLKSAGEVLLSVIGTTGNVFRIGGDEFVIVTNLLSGEAERIDREIREKAALWHGTLGQELSFSIGHAAASEFENCSIMQLVHEADQRMYEDKALYYRTSGRERRGFTNGKTL